MILETVATVQNTVATVRFYRSSLRNVPATVHKDTGPTIIRCRTRLSLT